MTSTTTYAWQSEPVDLAPMAPAVYIGRQEGIGRIPAMDLFNLTEDIPGHPKDSTVSEMTLSRVGFRLPSRETRSTVAA